MRNVESIPLSDTRYFKTVSGLWKSDRAPLKPCAVLRSTNFRPDGLFDYSDVARFDVEARQRSQRELKRDDIVVERSGGGPKQPVGRVALFLPSTDEVFCTSNFTTAFRVVDRNAFEPKFVALYLLHLYRTGATVPLQRATTGLRNLDWSGYLEFAIPKIPVDEQVTIVDLLEDVRQASHLESEQMMVFSELKRHSMKELFSRGLRSEALRETEVGMLPTSWNVVNLGSLGRIGNGSTPKRDTKRFWEGGSYPWITSGKVYDRMINAADEMVTDAALSECHLPRVRPGSLVIAITGQGKTLGNCALLGIEATLNQHLAYVSLDTNAVCSSYVRGYLETQYGYLRKVGSGGGSTKGALTCSFLRELPIPMPATRLEQQEIADVLDAIDGTADLHQRQKQLLEELFASALHKLMTGSMRVGGLQLSLRKTHEPVEVTA